MKKIHPTSKPAGIVAPSSETCAVRRSLMRAMLGNVVLLGVPTFVQANTTEVATAGSMRLYAGAALARYGFGDGHPLGVDRQGAFLKGAQLQGLLDKVTLCAPRQASFEEIGRFHTENHIAKVSQAERQGIAYLDNGDTPVFPGIFEASANVVGAALDGLASVMGSENSRSFQPIGGLHHAGRNHSAGFCVFNDLGVVIETLRMRYRVRRVGYVDIDVHHGDGIFYAYEHDPDLIFADIHEDGRSLYPGTGHENETGKGAAEGTKLNIPLKAGSGDKEFLLQWDRVERHLQNFQPEVVLFQCGADGLKGDPLAHLNYSPAVHAHAARRLRVLANRFSKGRLMAFGGGGYLLSNLTRAWTAVLGELA